MKQTKEACKLRHQRIEFIQLQRGSSRGACWNDGFSTGVETGEYIPISNSCRQSKTTSPVEYKQPTFHYMFKYRDKILWYKL